LSAAADRVVRQLKGVATTVLPTKNEAVDLEKGVIAVESIRRIQEQTRTVSKAPRFVIIDYVERMGHGAQNAFLKLLEEPPRNTYFLLLTHTPETLLPTIHSRAPQLEIRPITQQQSEALLDSLKVFDATKRTQLLFIAGGFPAELHRLVQDSKAFEKRAQIVRDARLLMQGKKYNGIVLAQKYKDDRASSLILASDALKLLRRSAAQQTNAVHILAKIDHLIQVYERIKANGNVRLQLAASVVY
jgi:DNA polymerase-3 subunit delta'